MQAHTATLSSPREARKPAPGDHVESGWGAGYQADGDTLTLTRASYDPVLAPGDSQPAYFTASGPTTSPTSYGVSGH